VPTYPAAGTTPWNGTIESIITDLSNRIAVLEGGATVAARPAYLQVISNDAPAWMKVGADSTGTSGAYLCDGTADDVQINAALAAATGSGGEGLVKLSGGRFFCSNSVLMQAGVCLEGCGDNTELQAVNITATTGYGTSVALVKAALVSSHAYRITNMHLNGNAAAGGTGDAIHFESTTASNDASGYPDTNPDPDVQIDHLLIRNFGNGTTRSGIVMDTDMRGTIISDMQMRSFSLHGIWFSGSPDSHISNVHMGTVTGNGYYMQGGNVKLTNCKAFYCDDAGFRITSGRGTMAACESQDNNIGAVFAAEPASCVGFTVDTAQTDGVIMSSSGYTLLGAQIFNRSGGRYATTTRGLTISGTLTDVNLLADVTPASITTPLSGTLTAANRNFARVNTESGTALALSVG
jgi:hypothetical protein